VTTAFGRHLVLDVHAGSAGPDHLPHGAGNHEGVPPAGIHVHQQRQPAGGGDAAHVFKDVVQGGHPQIGQAKRGVGHPGPGEVDGAKTALPGQQGGVGVDYPHKLERLFLFQRLAQQRTRSRFRSHDHLPGTRQCRPRSLSDLE